MAKESFYFSHDYNSRNDPKIVSLLMKTGMEGLGVYWCVIEMLYEQGGYLMQSECERIAFELHTDTSIVKTVIECNHLFKKDDERFWSESVLRRLAKRNEKSAKARESAFIKWDNAKAMRTHTDGYAIKERKGKEIKGISFDKKMENVVLEDGTKQKLGESQKSLLAEGGLSPKQVIKGSVY